MNANLFVWQPDHENHRFPKIYKAPTTENGEMICLNENRKMENLKHFFLEVPVKKGLPDFLYYQTWYLFVSERVVDLLSNFTITNIKIHEFTLLYKKKDLGYRYFWLNFSRVFNILDVVKSNIEIRNEGEPEMEYVNKIFNFIPDYSKVPTDDLFKTDSRYGNLKIFKNRLYEEIKKKGLTGCEFIPLIEYKRTI